MVNLSIGADASIAHYACLKECVVLGLVTSAGLSVAE
jgi:hypothetical protein